MSGLEAKKYLSSIQDLLVPTGLTRTESGKLSNEFVKLAADLGSFNNMKTADVIMDIQSALQGSSETMAKYGINVKAAKVEAEVFRLGLAKTKDEILDSHKAVAMYNIMIREGADAIGDMGRTSDSFTNQLKKLLSNIEHIQTTIGNNFLPVLTDVLISMNAWIKGNQEFINVDMVGYFKGVIESVLLFADALKIVVDIFDLLYESISDTGLFDSILFGKGGFGSVISNLSDIVYIIKKVKDGSITFGELFNLDLSKLDKAVDRAKMFDEYNNRPKSGGKSLVNPYTPVAIDVKPGTPVSKPTKSSDIDKWQRDFEQATLTMYEFEKLQLEKSRDENIKAGQDKVQAYTVFTKKLAELDRETAVAKAKDIQDTKDLIDSLYDKEFQEFSKTNDKIIALQAERDAFISKSTLTTFELERKELDENFKRFEAVTTNKITLLQAYGEAAKLITKNEADQKEKIDSDAVEKNKSKLQKWAEDVQTTNDMFTSLAINFSEGIAGGVVDALDAWFDGTMKAKDAMKEFAASFLRDISKMIIQQTILNSLKSGLSSGGFLSGIGSFFKMADGGVLPGGFKAFASGGMVTKPTLGLVGEGVYNEAVVPLPDGNSIPVKMTGNSGSGGASLNIVNNVTVASGSGGTDKERQDMATKTAATIKGMIKEIIKDEKRYGGLLWS
jgi:hypothetical protein